MSDIIQINASYSGNLLRGQQKSTLRPTGDVIRSEETGVFVIELRVALSLEGNFVKDSRTINQLIKYGQNASKSSNNSLVEYRREYLERTIMLYPKSDMNSLYILLNHKSYIS
jgi:hypothetical protein